MKTTSRYRLISLAANLFIVLMILTPPGLFWFLWIAGYCCLLLFGNQGLSIGFHGIIENVGRKITPILAFWGIVYGYFLTDPFASAMSNFFGVFFLFFSFDLPKLILQRNDFMERLTFSFVCAFIAFSGNIFVGNTLGALESIKGGVLSYEALSGRLWDVGGSLALVLLGLVAADFFCDIPILRMRRVTDYKYEKASGSLFYLSFFLGFGGNRIISPVLLIASFVLIVASSQEPKKRFPIEVWSKAKKMRESLVGKFVDTSIDQRLVTEAVLGSITLAMLNFRFFGHTQVEPIHIVVILSQTIPFWLFLYPRKPALTPYIVSNIVIFLTGLAGLVYMNSWPFCAFMVELSSHVSDLFSLTGVGTVASTTFLSAVIYLYLSITIDSVKEIPIDIVRRRMEKAFNQKNLEDLRKMYRFSILVMILACFLFALSLCPLLLEYRPAFGMRENGEMVYHDLFWVFLFVFPLIYGAKLMFSRHELHRPIDLLKIST